MARKLVPELDTASLTGDLAFLLPGSSSLPLACPRGVGQSRVMLVGWRDLSGYLTAEDEDRGRRHAADAVVTACDEGGFDRIEVVNLADRVDGEASERFALQILAVLRQRASALPVSLLDGLSLTGKLETIRAASGFVSGRMHGLLIGKLYGVPSVGIDYAGKVARLGGRLRPSPVSSLIDLVRSPDALGAVLAGELTSPSSFIDLSREIDQARRNLDLLKRFGLLGPQCS